MKKKLIIGIDPGASGAIAIQYPDQQPVVIPWTGESEFLNTIEELQVYCAHEKCSAVAYLEEVGGFIGKAQPGAAMFNFGRNFGFILGCLMSAGFIVNLVRPQVWQKGFPKTPKMDDKAKAKRMHKNALKEAAARLFPHLRVTLANADALLILSYGTKQ